jgi:hypothetical protein
MIKILDKLKSYRILIILLLISACGLLFFCKKARHHFFKGEVISSMGEIIRLQPNPRGDIDGIIIKTKDREITLGFPPHLASDVLAIADIGDKVSVLYEDEPHHHDSRLIAINNPSRHKSFDLHAHQPPRLDSGQDISLTITDYKFNVDDRNNPNGIIYNNYLVEIKPHLLEQLIPLIEKAERINVKGRIRNREKGFVNKHRYKIIKAFSIELDKKTYLLD